MSLSPHGVFIPVVLYVIINTLYSLWLKNIAIIDVFVIACGFVLRLWVGAICFDIPLSHWIVIVTFLLALFLALAKRRDDCILLERSGYKMRQNIESYNRVFLDVAMSVSASIVMVAYIFYSIDEEVIQRFGTDKLYFTSIFVLLGIFRYLQITFVYKRSSSPSKILLKDRFLQISILAWLICFVGLVYFKV
ncbi:UbiA prenyltransferase family protein [Helicobacter equorum]|uniref:phosphoribose diphosphate--decaprenyl-phosphate phosphoribosyltransferase n=1 Tax=Helicobacter equorum TaxID=361872 RepID=UPI000CF08FCB|nr:phosphoribose diphosphate--decaprenyl-phosphate phosphoribosyltransferase [Helicobacter equorum]